MGSSSRNHWYKNKNDSVSVALHEKENNLKCFESKKIIVSYSWRSFVMLERVWRMRASETLGIKVMNQSGLKGGMMVTSVVDWLNDKVESEEQGGGEEKPN